MPILLGLGISLGLFALYITTRPAAFRIERARTFDASPAALFALINDFHEWGKWSPWDKMDPDLKRTFEGPASGTGATYRWVGNSKVGEGSMTITDSVADSRVNIDLNFLKPFAANNKTIFTLEPDGASTRVTWAMEGNKNFASKAFGVFMNMDALVGKDFEKGLAAMAASTPH